MSEDDRPPTFEDATPPLLTAVPDDAPAELPRQTPRLKKLRLLIVLLPLTVLALVSTVYGMIMAIASDLPALENRAEYKTAQNSILTDVNGHRLGILTGRENRILVTSDDIPLVMKRAIIAVEDKRFYTNSGVDIQGIARAFTQDIFRQRAAQGASTITQQFVKNALQAQNRRTVFEKLREAALAYHLTRKWSKDKILTEYLNAIYFGNGAYGIESAARTYFGHEPYTPLYNCGTTTGSLCVKGLTPAQAALLAGIVASPAAYDPVSHPASAVARRNLVLRDMYEQRYITADEYRFAITAAPPTAAYVQPPQEKPTEPSAAYFTTWVKQQVVDHYGVQRAFEGGLTVRTTLDLDLQKAAVQAIQNYLADRSGPSAALVAIDNATGEVRALVGGRDYNESPFNLATQGQRQPGSAFKPFVLAQALRRGISPDSVWPSQKRIFTVPGTHGHEHFTVRNYEGSYAGSRTLAEATTTSDNSVYAAVGIKAGIPQIAHLARAAGIRTPVSQNYAISLGGLRRGVTALDMAHAYETFAHNGQLVTGTLGSTGEGPVGIHEVRAPGSAPDRNHVKLSRILPASLVQTEDDILHTVVTSGTGVRSQVDVWSAGKTGTTENFGDAWFVGFTKRLTVAVWVGYADRLRSMKTEFAGKPVAGGTYPALIWHDFMRDALQIYKSRGAGGANAGSGSGGGSGASGGSSGASSTTSTTAGPAPVHRTHKVQTPAAATPAPRKSRAPAPAAPAPATPPPATAQPPPAAAPPSGTGGGAQAPTR
jgi:penicillin-binding protein 1A